MKRNYITGLAITERRLSLASNGNVKVFSQILEATSWNF